MNGNRIKEVKARQVLDSKGRPVVETEIYTENGKMGRAGASTGTSVGKNESYVLRDNDKELFGGLSVFKAVKNIEEIIGPALVGMDVTDQQAVDHRMIELTGPDIRRTWEEMQSILFPVRPPEQRRPAWESHYGGTWQRKSRRGYLRRHII